MIMIRLVILVVFTLLAGWFCISCRTSNVVTKACPYDMAEVISQAGLMNTEPLQALCWKQKRDNRPLVVDSVIMLGSRGTNFVLVSAYRHPVGGSGRWNITEISIMFDWGDDWIIGEREFFRFPTDQEVENFKDDTSWNEGADRFQTVFEGKEKIRKPTSGGTERATRVRAPWRWM